MHGIHKNTTTRVLPKIYTSTRCPLVRYRGHRLALDLQKRQYLGLIMPREAPALASATRPPTPAHTAAQGIIGERSGTKAKRGQRGTWKGALAGTGLCSVPIICGASQKHGNPTTNTLRVPTCTHPLLHVYYCCADVLLYWWMVRWAGG